MNLTFLLMLHNWFFVLGGVYMWLSWILAVVIGVVVDEIVGDDVSDPAYNHPWVFNILLYLSLPLVFTETMLFAYYFSDTNFLWIEEIVGVFGYDIAAHRDATQAWHLFGAVLSLGISYGSAATNVAHELTHRTDKWFDMMIGRWLLAFTWDTIFSIEHVYGHHKNVATFEDPASARRDENAWSFAVRSTIGTNIHGFKFEANRLRRKGYSVYSWRNRAIRGQLMSMAITSLFYLAAGWLGVALFIVTALYGKAYLEFVNYIEHWGIVRVPGQPVEHRHSWNSNRKISSAVLFNLTRHSYHHQNARAPFWEIKSTPAAPTLPYGYMSMILLAAIPPLWRRVMGPKLADWDQNFATQAERDLIAAKG